MLESPRRSILDTHGPHRRSSVTGAPVNRIERLARRFDRWQQRHRLAAFAVAVLKKFGDDQAGYQVALLTYFAFVGTFPLLLALTTILGLALRKYPELQRDLLNSAFAEFPIVGTQIHDQLGSLVPPPLTDADKAYHTDAVRAEGQRPEQRLDIEYVPDDRNAPLHDAG
jgi:hypothetical protein